MEKMNTEGNKQAVKEEKKEGGKEQKVMKNKNKGRRRKSKKEGKEMKEITPNEKIKETDGKETKKENNKKDEKETEQKESNIETKKRRKKKKAKKCEDQDVDANKGKKEEVMNEKGGSKENEKEKLKEKFEEVIEEKEEEKLNKRWRRKRGMKGKIEVEEEKGNERVERKGNKEEKGKKEKEETKGKEGRKKEEANNKKKTGKDENKLAPDPPQCNPEEESVVMKMHAQNLLIERVAKMLQEPPYDYIRRKHFEEILKIVVVKLQMAENPNTLPTDYIQCQLQMCIKSYMEEKARKFLTAYRKEKNKIAPYSIAGRLHGTSHKAEVRQAEAKSVPSDDADSVNDEDKPLMEHFRDTYIRMVSDLAFKKS